MKEKLKKTFLIKEDTNENIGNMYDISNEAYNIAIMELLQVTKLEINEDTYNRLFSNLRLIPCGPPMNDIKYEPKFNYSEKALRVSIKLTKSEKLIAFLARMIFILKYNNHGATRFYITKGNELDKIIAKTSIRLDFTDMRLFFSYIVLKYSAEKDYNVKFIHGRLTDDEKKLIGCQEYPSCFIRKEAN